MQDRFQQIAMISALFAMSPSSVEYGMNLSAAQVISSAASIMPPSLWTRLAWTNAGSPTMPAHLLSADGEALHLPLTSTMLKRLKRSNAISWSPAVHYPAMQ